MSIHKNGYRRKGSLSKGHRHNPFQEAERLIDYLERNPKFRGAVIGYSHGKTSLCLTVGDLKGAKSVFTNAITLHENKILPSNKEHPVKPETRKANA